MKLLLDENLPKRIKTDFPEYEIHTVRDMGWNGIKNGELLRLMNEQNFNVLLTFDKNLQHQQNLVKYNLPVLVLSAIDNSYLVLKNLVPKIKAVLETELKPGATVIQL